MPTSDSSGINITPIKRNRMFCAHQSIYMPAQLSLNSPHFDLKECRSLFMRWVINADRPR